MATESSARNFFTSPYFAVVGSFNNPSKFAHKIFTWYTERSLPATPISLTPGSVAVNGTQHPILPSLSSLPDPTQTSISIVTPPAITRKLLEEAKKLGIWGVWLQPGTYDDEILKTVLRDWKESGVGGFGGGTVGGEGWCVLVDGDRVGREAGLKL